MHSIYVKISVLGGGVTLKFKEVPLFTWDTLKLGIVFTIVIAIIGIVLMRTIVGLVLYFNFIGYIVYKYYKTQPMPNFFSVRCLSIGWSISWRSILFALPLIIPIYVVLILMAEPLNINPQTVNLIKKIVVYLVEVIAFGWAIERVRLLDNKKMNPNDKANEAELCSMQPSQ